MFGIIKFEKYLTSQTWYLILEELMAVKWWCVDGIGPERPPIELLLLSNTSALCPWLISRRARRGRGTTVFIGMLLKTLCIYLTQCPFYKNLSEQFFFHFGARKIYTIIFQVILFSSLLWLLGSIAVNL